MESGELWASQITEDGALWLGAGRDAANLEQLRRHKITHILNCADDVPDFHRGEPWLQYCNLGLGDFGTDAGSARVFPAAVAFVRAALSTEPPAGQASSARVLVHCANGSNRSATVMIALLMAFREVSLAAAWSAVQAARPQCNPLADNRRQLLAYEIELRGGANTMAEGPGGKLQACDVG